MDLVFFLPLVAICLVASIAVIERLNIQWILLNPCLYFIGFGILHYHIRGMLLILDNRVDVDQIISPIIFCTLFYILTLYSYYLIINQSGHRYAKWQSFTSTPLDDNDYRMVNRFLLFLFIWFSVSEISKLFSSSGFYALYVEFETLEVGTTNSIIYFGEVFSPIIIFLSLFLFKERGQKIHLFMLIMVLFVSLTEAVISTGKGLLVSTFIILTLSALISGYRIRFYWYVSAIISAFGFSVYSYLARYYGFTSGESSIAAIVETSLLVIDNFGDWRSVGLENGILERFNYLDGLILTMDFDGQKGYYVSGSLAELGNFIPRLVWPDRPHLSFNHFLTTDLWGMTSLVSETPIGRIGEAYFVASWGGLVYAVIYGILFAKIRLWISSGKVLDAVFYIFIFISYAFPDAYLFYGIKNVAFGSLIILILWYVLKAIDNRNKQTHHGPVFRTVLD